MSVSAPDIGKMEQAFARADVAWLVFAAGLALRHLGGTDPETSAKIRAARRRVRYAMNGDPADAPTPEPDDGERVVA